MQNRSNMRVSTSRSKAKRKLNKNFMKKLESKQAKQNKNSIASFTSKEMSKKILKKPLKNAKPR